MTGPTDLRPARVLALHAGVLADRAETSAADWGTSAGYDPLAATLHLGRFAIAHDHLTVLAARLATLPPHTGGLDSIDLRMLADRITAALRRMRRPDGQPAPPADVADAAGAVREVADVLLAAAALSVTPTDRAGQAVAVDPCPGHCQALSAAPALRMRPDRAS